MAVSSAANAACVTKLAYYVSITGSKYKKKKMQGEGTCHHLPMNLQKHSAFFRKKKNE
jgi:hypothetical protein